MIDLRSEFRELSDDIFISSLYIFDIRDTRLACGDHTGDDHRHSRSKIPARHHRSTEWRLPEYECFMRIQDRDMSFHFLDLDEPVQPSLEEDFVYPRDTISLCHEERKGWLKIGRKSRENIRLDIDRFEVIARVIDTECIISEDFVSYTDFSALHEEWLQIADTSVMDVEIFSACQCCEDDERPTLYVIMDHGSAVCMRARFAPFDRNRMIIGYTYLHACTTEHIDETQNMGFDRSESDRRFSFSEGICDDHILCRCHSESTNEFDIFVRFFSSQWDIFLISRIFIPHRSESIDMFIDGSFPEITSPRKWKIDLSETIEQYGNEENSDSDFLDLFLFEMGHTHIGRIHLKSISFERNLYSERFYDGEKCEHITDAGDILETSMVEKEARSDKWECGIFRSWDFDGSREKLGSIDMEQGHSTNRKKSVESLKKRWFFAMGYRYYHFRIFLMPCSIIYWMAFSWFDTYFTHSDSREALQSLISSSIRMSMTELVPS